MDDLLKPKRVRVTQLDAWPVVSSALFDFTPASDDIISIVGRAGLNVDWNLNPKEAYSHSTRKRAYRPRVHAAYSELGPEDSDTVLSLIIGELAHRFPMHTDAIKTALARVGWTLKAVPEIKQPAGETQLTMKRNKELQRLLLLQVRDGKEPPELAQFPEQEQVYNSALLINDGYVDGEAIQNGSGVYVSTVMIQLTSKGHDFLDETENMTQPSVVTGGHAEAVSSKTIGMPKTSKLIFISHSSADEDLAEALVDMLCTALTLRRADFLCTSVDGAKLRGGDDTDDVLRREIRDVPAFLSLLTREAVTSTYVLFELGARWGNERHHIPLLAKGAGADVLREPLKAKNALQLSKEADVLQLVTDLAAVLGRNAEPPNSYLKKARTVVEVSLIGAKSADSSRLRSVKLYDDESTTAKSVPVPFRFEAKDAELHGTTVQYEHDEIMDNIGYWNSREDFVTWTFNLIHPASFSVVVEQACMKGCGGEYAVVIGSERLEAKVVETDQWQNFSRRRVGHIDIKKPGTYKLKVEPIRLQGGALMNLRAIVLHPVI